MALVVRLANAGAAGAGVSAVGGKGASLGELARAGVAVPPGFVVTVEAFAAAMAAIDPSGAHRASVEALDAADLAGIAGVAARLRALVTEAPLPAEVAAAISSGYADLGADAGARAGAEAGAGADVAVRSSATVEDSAEASFAGLQDTYLGVSGAAAVLGYVRRCWASLYNDESVAYRRRLGLPEAGVAMAVVVQRMVAPRAAGVMFTRSPVTGDRSVVAIEGTWGLGSALVSGDVTPDAWVISKITGDITSRRVSPKVKIHIPIQNGSLTPPSPPSAAPGEAAQPVAEAGGQAAAPSELGWVAVRDNPAELRDAPCLTDDEIRALAAVARRVEAHYGAPQDIEWAVLDAPFAQASGGAGASGGSAASAESRVVLLQSRPETVWAAREMTPAGAPKARAADHVLALFGKPL
ncbi:MAG TPA: PEP/pyruvate-binding domain-containing protein [Trebonia sp.]|nr:PEP/pyruvate-binding domain-containing protein [Trebonia sp.]